MIFRFLMYSCVESVQSYEKQGFHSGTPPPFNLAGNQSAGIAPSGTYGPQMYIPTMPHQQHHNTTLMHQPLHQVRTTYDHLTHDNWLPWLLLSIYYFRCMCTSSSLYFPEILLSFGLSDFIIKFTGYVSTGNTAILFRCRF